MISVNQILPEKLEELRDLPDLSFVHDKRILVFGLTPQWINYCALISIVLVHRGCKIDFVWSPTFEHDNADIDAFSQMVCNIFEPTFRKVDHSSIRFINLRDLPMAELGEELRDAVNAQSHEDVIHFTREINNIPEKDHPELYGRRKHYNHECIASLLTLIKENDYDLVLEPNGKVFEWGAVYRLARHLEIPISTIENLPPMVQGIVHSWNHPAIIWNEETIDKLWHKNAPHIATDKTYQRVKQFKLRRNDPESDHSLQFCKGGKVDQLRVKLKLPRNHSVVLMLPSLGYEKFFRLEHRCFKNPVDWFKESVKYFAGRKDCTLIIRAHPYPYGDGREDKMNHQSSGEIPERLLSRLFDSENIPDNIRFIGATEEVNTYDLMELSDWSITYSSGAGLDMALSGKNTVVASPIHYNNKGFTKAPKSRLEYFQCIDQLLSDKSLAKLTSRQIELAHCYTEFFYYHFPISFPWNISEPGFRYTEWPLERVLSLECLISPFMDSFDRLVDSEPVSDERKLREVSTYLDKIFKTGNYDVRETRTMLRNINEIDFSSLHTRYPRTAQFLMNRWPELSELYNRCYNKVYECISQGTKLAEKGELYEAAKSFEAAIGLDIHCADAWNHIGVIFNKTNQPDAAVTAFKSGLVAQPTHADCSKNLKAMAHDS